MRHIYGNSVDLKSRWLYFKLVDETEASSAEEQLVRDNRPEGNMRWENLKLLRSPIIMRLLSLLCLKKPFIFIQFFKAKLKPRVHFPLKQYNISSF